MAPERTVGVAELARVEGEGALRVVVQDGAVSEVVLNIFEPPRFFEAFLVGRSYKEVPDITARICGICPVAYQMTSCAAIEDAFGQGLDDAFVATPGPQIGHLRRLLYCGEWLQSHALHVYFLHAPDFFGCQDAVELGALDPAALHRGLDLKNIGNRIMTVVGGRAIHPVNVRVGGFYKAPRPEAVHTLEEPLRRALDAALETVQWVSHFDFPDVESDHVLVALRGQGRYPIEGGRVASSEGLDCTPAELAEVAVEEHVERSSALHSRLYGRLPYLTGPLARYALNSSLLPPLAREAAARAGLPPVCRNPFRSIVVRSVEMVMACEEALRLVHSYEPPDPPAVEMPASPHGQVLVGAGATEAPRGLLLHRYELADGLVAKARIMPPTSQNQLAIEADLRSVAEAYMDAGDDELGRRAEMAVRNHDPCISCAAHFLDVKVERRASGR
ncbi:MAG TPA: Ni/Fe hydrogenase subunit alpha [Acidimicrobiales bacterium]|nr:Ni/Fe hydrogenase subunit alpha [Acidimicrobiales bacterium]